MSGVAEIFKAQLLTQQLGTTGQLQNSPRRFTPMKFIAECVLSESRRCAEKERKRKGRETEPCIFQKGDGKEEKPGMLLPSKRAKCDGNQTSESTPSLWEKKKKVGGIKFLPQQNVLLEQPLSQPLVTSDKSTCLVACCLC